jgi:hypothetical protein
MAKQVLTEERKIEMFLKILVETAALQLLFTRWADENDQENYEWQIKMEVLSEILDRKLGRREDLVTELKDHFPEIIKFDWAQLNH